MGEIRAPALDPGARKAKTGCFWALAREDRSSGGKAPSDVAVTFFPGQDRQHTGRNLQGFGGPYQVDGV